MGKTTKRKTAEEDTVTVGIRVQRVHGESNQMEKTSSEVVLLEIQNVKHKNDNGRLYLMSERLAWIMGNPNVVTVSHKYTDIKGQKITLDEGSTKAQLQIVLHDDTTYTFHFMNEEGPSAQFKDREQVTKLLQRILQKFRRKVNPELEEATAMACATQPRPQLPRPLQQPSWLKDSNGQMKPEFGKLKVVYCVQASSENQLKKVNGQNAPSPSPSPPSTLISVGDVEVDTYNPRDASTNSMYESEPEPLQSPRQLLVSFISDKELKATLAAIVVPYAIEETEDFHPFPSIKNNTAQNEAPFQDDGPSSTNLQFSGRESPASISMINSLESPNPNFAPQRRSQRMRKRLRHFDSDEERDITKSPSPPRKRRKQKSYSSEQYESEDYSELLTSLQLKPRGKTSSVAVNQNQAQRERQQDPNKLEKGDMRKVFQMYIEYTSTIIRRMMKVQQTDESQSSKENTSSDTESQNYSITDAKDLFQNEFQPRLQEIEKNEELMRQIPIFFIRIAVEIFALKQSFCNYCGVPENPHWCSSRAHDAGEKLITDVTEIFKDDTEFQKFARKQIVKNYQLNRKRNVEEDVSSRKKPKNVMMSPDITDVILRRKTQEDVSSRKKPKNAMMSSAITDVIFRRKPEEDVSSRKKQKKKVILSSAITDGIFLRKTRRRTVFLRGSLCHYLRTRLGPQWRKKTNKK